MTQGILFGTAALLTVLLGVTLRGDKRKVPRGYLLKGMALVLLAMTLVDCYLSDSFIWVIKNEIYSGVFYNRTDVWQTILRWGRNTTWAVCLMATFFDSRLFKGLALYLSLPFNVASVFAFDRFMDYFMARGIEPGRGINMPENVRGIWFAAELVLCLVLPLSFLFADGFRPHPRDAAGKGMLPAALAALLLAMPSYAPQSLFGYTRIHYASFNAADLVFIGATLLLTALLWRGFRFRSERTRRMVVYYLALVLFMHHNTQYLMGISFDKLPFQLCNLGCYTIILALLLKKRGFFDFTFIANVLGTIIAIVIPEMDDGVLSFWSVHYVIEHALVFAVPVLAVLFGMFPRPDRKSLTSVTVGFSIYYISCLVLGTLINGFAAEYHYGKVNYFFMFDTEMVTRVFPFAAFTVKWHVVMGRFECWPILQTLVYVVYLLLCYLFYFAVKKVFAWMDDREELRLMRLRMTAEYRKRHAKTKDANQQMTETDECLPSHT